MAVICSKYELMCDNHITCNMFPHNLYDVYSNGNFTGGVD